MGAERRTRILQPLDLALDFLRAGERGAFALLEHLDQAVDAARSRLHRLALRRRGPFTQRLVQPARGGRARCTARAHERVNGTPQLPHGLGEDPTSNTRVRVRVPRRTIGARAELRLQDSDAVLELRPGRHQLRPGRHQHRRPLLTRRTPATSGTRYAAARADGPRGWPGAARTSCGT